MSAREPLEWYFKLLDQSVGLSFKGEARGRVFLMRLEETSGVLYNYFNVQRCFGTECCYTSIGHNRS